MKAHPRPWRFEQEDYPDEGSIVDANGETVMYFGHDEQYYPTSGEAPDTEALDYLLRAVNNFEASSS